MEQFWFSALQAFCAEEYMVQEKDASVEKFFVFSNEWPSSGQIASIPQKMPEWSVINYRKKFGSNNSIYHFFQTDAEDFSKEILDSFIEDY